MSGPNTVSTDRAKGSPTPQPALEDTPTSAVGHASNAREPEAPPHHPAWHDISLAEKVGLMVSALLLPPVGIIWGIVYSCSLPTARRQWGRRTLAVASISLLVWFLGTLLVLAQAG